MTIFHCEKGCCEILTRNVDHSTKKWKYAKHLKAGMCIQCTTTNRILIVQSNGQKWGPPKGKFEDSDKTLKKCAIREVLEETGILIPENLLDDNKIKRIDNATYFYIYLEYEHSVILDTETDSTGITWIHKDCLKDLVDQGKMDITMHCKKLLF